MSAEVLSPSVTEMDTDDVRIEGSEQGEMPPNRSEAIAPAPVPAEAANPKKRPRLDLNPEPRKKGRSMFGILVGTLKQAKTEGSKREQSDAAKGRAQLDQRLARELGRNKDKVRKEDESKRDRTAASRKEEDLAIKDGMIRYRHAIFPPLSEFLLTTDIIPANYDPSLASDKPNLPQPPMGGPRVHKANASVPLYYLPAILLPQQKAFLETRKNDTEGRVKLESDEWKSERQKGIVEIEGLRKSAREAEDAARAVADAADSTPKPRNSPPPSTGLEAGAPVDMEVEAETSAPLMESTKPETSDAPMADEGEDVVEY